MSDTPRTDKAWGISGYEDVPLRDRPKPMRIDWRTDFARQLERELVESKARLAEVEAERDALRVENVKLAATVRGLRHIEARFAQLARVVGHIPDATEKGVAT